MDYSSSTHLHFPSTTDSSPSPSQSLALNTQKQKRIISELQRGWKAANELRWIHVAAGDRTLWDQEKVDAVNLLVTIVSSFSYCLSMFSAGPSYSVKGSEVGEPVMSRKAKSRRDDHHKPMKNGKKRELDTTDLTDDGFVWRKYGQKPIRTSAHPRHYYKCTYWDDQKCQAMKWVQKVSEEPSLYHTIYSGEHTCRSHLRSLGVTLDASSLPDDQPVDYNFYINFDGRSNLPWTSTATKDDAEMNQRDIKSSCRFFSNPSSSSSSSVSLPDMALPEEEHSDGGSSLLAVSSDHQTTQTINEMTRNTSTYEDNHQPTTTTMNQYSSDDYNYTSSVLHEPMTTAFSSSFAFCTIEH